MAQWVEMLTCNTSYSFFFANVGSNRTAEDFFFSFFFFFLNLLCFIYFFDSLFCNVYIYSECVSVTN